MASNYKFRLVAISEMDEILVLQAQTIVIFSLYPIIWGLRSDSIDLLFLGSSCTSTTMKKPQKIWETEYNIFK